MSLSVFGSFFAQKYSFYSELANYFVTLSPNSNKMILHIFNPEHDIALASGLSNFTAPHAGRHLRHDLGYLPAIWASENDVIVVDDPEYAAHRWKRLAPRLARLGETNGYKTGPRQFLTWKELQGLADVTIEPWGWNSALRALLLRSGLKENLLPTMESLDTIRELSHRRVASSLLPQLRVEGTTGESFECRTTEEVESLLARYGRLVLKAPWSSSGRGLRFHSLLNPQPSIHNWINNIVASQGSVMVEPYYNKVKDFGMEFYSDGRGRVQYLGLSLFQTQNGAYTGNILATETVKEDTMSRFLSPTLLQTVREEICRRLGKLFCDKYCGPFGVDMMVVGCGMKREGRENLLHPCVEINLRRTMGHVALALSPHDDDVRHVMRIDYNENVYKLRIQQQRGG